jgi:hypothetical protein
VQSRLSATCQREMLVFREAVPAFKMTAAVTSLVPIRFSWAPPWCLGPDQSPSHRRNVRSNGMVRAILRRSQANLSPPSNLTWRAIEASTKSRRSLPFAPKADPRKCFLFCHKRPFWQFWPVRVSGFPVRN